jgi:hypothetical protein
MKKLKAVGHGGILAAIILVCSLGEVMVAGGKLDPKDVVARHLLSVGGIEKLSARKSSWVSGVGTLRRLVGGSFIRSGSAIFLSEGPRVRFCIDFRTTDYPTEQFLYDGSKFETGYLRPGIRTELGSFLNDYSSIVKEGLVGGVLSTAWPLPDLEARKARLQYAGTRKVDGKEVHEIKYIMKKSPANMDIFLYFEPETFRHVATFYRIVIPSMMGPTGPDTSSGQVETRYELQERFSDFREVNGLMLPSRWVIQFASTTGTAEKDERLRGRTSLLEWQMVFDKFTANLPVGPKDFTIQ